ncbi:uncharacterized protein N7459_005718 [Penicillium hispanicum]|uniref:uncharacterized protein n=1 Tax=Penicillium hispanicum TaxID=1080232 RepID=UPI00254205BD|nr:uncharacterized protein N7459_005718 [Penicillium hispanicum]KAJ5579733.1 hypothetical protein N7459_005718 [Penicillium hispanicum]
MDVLDRLQSGLFYNANTLDSSPTFPRRRILSHEDVSPINYINNAPSDIPAAPSSLINRPTPEIPLPLLSVSADVDTQGRLCTTTVTQQFSNASSSVSQNAKYIFPIYDGSVVTSFRCWIGNEKLLEGAVKAKEAARADFDHAVIQRKVAVLVEELAPEVFETSVGNIPAQTTVKIEITCANLLKVDTSTGGLVLTIPTSIAPRYGNVPAGYSGNQSILTEGLRINVQASMPKPIQKMESRSHPISVEMGAVAHKDFKNFAASASSYVPDYSKGRATLADRQAVLHEDFVLHILCGSREPARSRAIAAAQPGQPARSTIAVTIHPNDLFRQSVNVSDFVGELILVADRSGSMSSKIPSLINVMNIFLRSLPETCSFNIASFGSNVTWLWPSSERYSQENLDVASKHVDLFRADYGGTDIYPALQSALDHSNKQDDVPTSVILLTDGEVWDVDNVIQLVRRTVSVGGSNIRFFSLGIGDQVSHRLVEGIGQQGGGYAEVVPESSMGLWQERVIQMLKAALAPSRLQCNLDLGNDLAIKTSERQIAGYKVQYPEVVQAPHHIPVLNVFSHFSLYYMLESGLDSLPKTVNITATTDKGEKLTAQLPIQVVAGQAAIHHLAAKALMNDYETGQSWLHLLNPTLKPSNPIGFKKVLRQEAQHLGQRWSIPSKWTSYVAIDRSTALQHAILLHKADAIEVSQLTRPRHTSSSRCFPAMRMGGSGLSVGFGPSDDCLGIGSWTTEKKKPPTQSCPPASQDAKYELGDVQNCEGNIESHMRIPEPRLEMYTEISEDETSASANKAHAVFYDPPGSRRLRQPSPSLGESTVYSMPRSNLHDPDSTLPEFPAMETILRKQRADGTFSFFSRSFTSFLRKKYDSNALEKLLDSKFNRQSQPARWPLTELSYNILAVVYITREHAASKALWELQVEKARQWIKRMIVGLLKGSGDSEESLEMLLEELGALFPEMQT